MLAIKLEIMECKVEPEVLELNAEKDVDFNSGGCESGNPNSEIDDANETNETVPLSIDNKEVYGSDISSAEEEDNIHSKVSDPSLSLSTISAIETDDEQKKFVEKRDYTGGLNYVLRNARFFLMKSSNEENINLSKLKSIWSTPPENETKINRVFRNAPNVLLIFSIKESGKFSGFARLASESTRNDSTVNWVIPRGLKQKDLGRAFSIDWISKNDVPFSKTQHLFNPWNEGKPIKIGRDGQEIQPHVASELCRLFPMDNTTDWNVVLKRSKETTKRLNQSKVASIKSHIMSRKGISFKGRTQTRDRFLINVRGPKDFYCGRVARNRVPDGDFKPRSNGYRGRSFYRGSRGNRGYHMNVNRQYANNKSRDNSQFWSPPRNKRSPKYGRRGYYRRSSPSRHSSPPSSALLEDLPIILPRYYDGPPRFSSTLRPGMENEHSTPNYDEAVIEFLRQKCGRSETARNRDRDRDYRRSRDRNYRR